MGGLRVAFVAVPARWRKSVATGVWASLYVASPITAEIVSRLIETGLADRTAGDDQDLGLSLLQNLSELLGPGDVRTAGVDRVDETERHEAVLTTGAQALRQLQGDRVRAEDQGAVLYQPVLPQHANADIVSIPGVGYRLEIAPDNVNQKTG